VLTRIAMADFMVRDFQQNKSRHTVKRGGFSTS